MWKRLVVGATSVAVLSTSAAADPTWTKMSPGGGGAFLSVDVASNGKVLAGSDLSGAYRRDGTGNWTRLGKRDGLEATSVECVKWKPGQADIALVGTRNGVFQSTDSAKTWSQKSFNTQIVTALGWKGDTVYAAGSNTFTTTNLLLKKSVDNGATWSDVSYSGFNGENIRVVKLVVSPLGADTVWLLSGNDRSSKNRVKELWKSTDGGASWTKKSTSFNAIDLALPSSGRPLLMTTSATGPGGDDTTGTVQGARTAPATLGRQARS